VSISDTTLKLTLPSTNTKRHACLFTFTTLTDPNTMQAQQASHAAWNVTMMHPCLLCHIIAKTGMTDQHKREIAEGDRGGQKG
jgi:hypothetical protein